MNDLRTLGVVLAGGLSSRMQALGARNDGGRHDDGTTGDDAPGGVGRGDERLEGRARIDKAALVHDGRSLLDRAIDRLRPQVDVVIVNAGNACATSSGHASFPRAPSAGIASASGTGSGTASTTAGPALRGPGIGTPDIVPDIVAGQPGPLAGMHAALRHAVRCNERDDARIGWVATVPCDSPSFPTDLVARLHAAARQARVATAVAATLPTDGDARAGHQRDRGLVDGAGRGTAVDGRPGETALDLHPVFALVRIDCLPALEAALQRGERRVRAWLRAQGMAVATFDDAAAFVNINTPDQWQAWTTR